MCSVRHKPIPSAPSFTAFKVSAGVSTGIGDHESKYSGKESDEVQGDEQFEIDDNRSLDKMYKDIEDEGLQPVLNDYLYV